MMAERILATIPQDETIARRAVHAALTVLQESGLKAESATVDWSRVSFPEFQQTLNDAYRAVRRTLIHEYRRRGLRTTGWRNKIVDTHNLLLISAVQAWLAGGNAFSIHPFSASSYTWLAVSTFTAMHHLEDEYRMQRTDALGHER